MRVGNFQRAVPLAIAVTCLGAAMAFAQERAGAAYVAGGAAAVYQDGVSGQVPVTYTTAPGGTTVGWSAGAGVFFSRYVSVEATFATTGSMSAREPSRYGMTFNEERRDRFFVGGVRFHAPVRRAFDVEPVAMFGIVSTLVTSQTEYAPCVGCTGPIRLDPKTAQTVSPRPVLAFGCDARIGGAHVAIVPSFRVTRAGEYPESPTYYPGGVSLTTIGGGAALRVTF